MWFHDFDESLKQTLRPHIDRLDNGEGGYHYVTFDASHPDVDKYVASYEGEYLGRFCDQKAAALVVAAFFEDASLLHSAPRWVQQMRNRYEAEEWMREAVPAAWEAHLLRKRDLLGKLRQIAVTTLYEPTGTRR